MTYQPHLATITPLEARDPSELYTRLRVSLDESGFAWSGELASEADFEAIARQLGAIVLRTDIRVSPLEREKQRARRGPGAERPGVYQAEALAFHSDRPTIRFLGWYCVQQDARFGDSMLIDTRDIEQSFTREELKTLQQVPITYYDGQPDGGGAEVRHDWPVVSSTPNGYQIFYVPWNLPASVSPEQRAVLAKCADYVARKEQSDLISIRLQPWQCLFIDNHRMLHARQALPPDSPRHLVRLYIQ